MLYLMVCWEMSSQNPYFSQVLLCLEILTQVPCQCPDQIFDRVMRLKMERTVSQLKSSLIHISFTIKTEHVKNKRGKLLKGPASSPMCSTSYVLSLHPDSNQERTCGYSALRVSYRECLLSTERYCDFLVEHSILYNVYLGSFELYSFHDNFFTVFPYSQWLITQNDVFREA